VEKGTSPIFSYPGEERGASSCREQSGRETSRKSLMMPTFQEVLTAALTLSPTDRVRLAAALWEDWDAVPLAEWPLPSEEWIAEAQRRSAEYDEGRMSAATWPEVQARARRRAGLDE
jgi:putative addiction module component (TIGR02574 family)